MVYDWFTGRKSTWQTNNSVLCTIQKETYIRKIKGQEKKTIWHLAKLIAIHLEERRKKIFSKKISKYLFQSDFEGYNPKILYFWHVTNLFSLAIDHPATFDWPVLFKFCYTDKLLWWWNMNTSYWLLAQLNFHFYRPFKVCNDFVVTYVTELSKTPKHSISRKKDIENTWNYTKYK